MLAALKPEHLCEEADFLQRLRRLRGEFLEETLTGVLACAAFWTTIWGNVF
jgi:hypothetical protein